MILFFVRTVSQMHGGVQSLLCILIAYALSIPWCAQWCLAWCVRHVVCPLFAIGIVSFGHYRLFVFDRCDAFV